MKLFKINDKNIVAGLDWKKVLGATPKIISSNMKKEVIKRDRNSFYATYLDIYKEHKYTYYAHSDNVVLFEKSTVYPAAAFFIKDFKGHVIVKKLEEIKENGNQYTLYWLCAIDEEGIIIEDSCVRDDKIDVKITEYLEVQYLLASYKNDYLPYSPEITINKIFNDDAFDSEFADKYKFVKYKKDEIRFNHNLVIGGILIGLGTFLFNQYYDTGLKKEIEKSNYLAQFNKDKKDYLTAWENQNRGNRNQRRRGSNNEEMTYSPAEIEDFGKKQIQERFDLQRYENLTILNNIIELERTYPLFLVEWNFEKLAYSLNKFILIFSKIPDSNGVFTDLDFIMQDIAKHKDFVVIPAALENNGTVRIYEIDFNNFKTINSGNQTLTLFEIRQNQKEKIEEIIKNIKSKENIVGREQGKVKNIKAFKQIFSKDLNNIKNTINREVSNLKKLYTDLKTEIEYQPEGYEMTINLKTTSGLQHLKNSQVYSEFNWGFPTSRRSFPVMQGRNARNITPYAYSYNVSISSKTNLTNSFEDMLFAGEKFSAENIIIDRVEYDLKTGDWKIDGLLFEKVENKN